MFTIKYFKKICVLFLFVSVSVFCQNTKKEIPEFNKQKLEQMDAAIRDQSYPNIHSVLISYRGNLIFEQYYSGKDEAWGTDLGVVNHTSNTLHDLRSITKSIVALCVGIALEQGLISGVNQNIFDFFPEYAQFNIGAYSNLTINHLLTMTSGLKWNEDVPYTDPDNSETQMLMSDNPVKFMLSQPMVNEPGKKWEYNGGTTEMLAAIIQKASGLSIDEFADKYLFQPLDIETFYWAKSPFNGITVAASGLRLLPLDQLKIGELLLNEGIYKGKKVLNKEWIRDSFSSQISRGQSGSYGYQFWIDPSPANANINLIAAIGNGNQRIYIDENMELVVVINSGNYNMWNVKKGSYQLMTDFIYPALIKN